MSEENQYCPNCGCEFGACYCKSTVISKIKLPELTEKQFDSITLPLVEVIQSYKALIGELVAVLEAHNRNHNGDFCSCEVAIDNPNYRGKHDKPCIAAKDLIAKARARMGK